MKRPYVHLLVDAGLGLCGLALVCTGLLLAIVLPAQSRQASVWGMTRHDWGEVHLWIALTMLAVVTIHLALNWRWVCNVAGKLCGDSANGHTAWRRHVAATVCLAVVVGVVAGFLWLAVAMREADLGRERPGHLGGGIGPRWGQIDPR